MSAVPQKNDHEFRVNTTSKLRFYYLVINQLTFMQDKYTVHSCHFLCTFTQNVCYSLNTHILVTTVTTLRTTITCVTVITHSFHNNTGKDITIF